MAKLKRQALIHFVDATLGKDTPTWFKIGQDIEEMSVALNPEVEVKENIWNETSISDKGYKPQLEVTPYYANPTDAIYEPLKEIAMQRKSGDDCKTKYLEVIIEDASAASHEAYQEDCIIKPTSYGGGTDGVEIPYTIYPNGNRVKGTVTITGGVPTFKAN